MRQQREGPAGNPAFLSMSPHKLGPSLLLCVAVLALAGTRANAAPYHAYLCKVPYGPNAGRPAPAEATTYTQNSATTSASESCASGGPMTASLDGSGPHTVGEGASVIYEAPDGLSISGFRLWRHERVGSAGGGAPFTKLTYTASAPVETPCTVTTGCIERGTSSPLAAGNEVAASSLSGVTQIRWDVFCGGTPGATCPAEGPNARSAYDVFAADVLLNDALAPVASNVSGPLLAGGTLAGAQSASFLATDRGSGVYKGSLIVDGVVVSETVLDAVGGACAELGVSPDGLPSYLNTRPCRAAVNGLLTLDTDLLSAGSHDLTIRVADAAGNQTVARSAAITVVGPRPAGTPNGTGASRFAKLTAQFAGKRARRVRRVGFRTLPTITGRLADENGSPIGSATVDVLVRDRRAGAQLARIATATTAADGTFRVRLPSGPSRAITVLYRAFSGDPKATATVTLSTRVRARIGAALTPRVLRVGGRMRLSGRLGYLPRRGVAVIIQVRNGRVWQTYGVVKTDADGRYRWTYRFKTRGSAGKTFAFRAKVDSPIYPFTATTSRPVYVAVRG